MILDEECAVCHGPASQEHHIFYDPEIKIDVCVECHELIHEHGVGSGRQAEEYYVSLSGNRIPLATWRPKKPEFTRGGLEVKTLTGKDEVVVDELYVEDETVFEEEVI